jgi:hypothetical protein
MLKGILRKEDPLKNVKGGNGRAETKKGPWKEGPSVKTKAAPIIELLKGKTT